MANKYASVLKYRTTLKRTKPGQAQEVGGTKPTFLFTAGYVVSQGSEWVYGEDWSGATRMRQFYGKLIVESSEDTMPEIPQEGRYGEADYGTLKDLIRYTKECGLCQ